MIADLRQPLPKLSAVGFLQAGALTEVKPRSAGGTPAAHAVCAAPFCPVRVLCVLCAIMPDVCRQLVCRAEPQPRQAGACHHAGGASQFC